MEEIWKAVLGYENYYEVSNYGNVRSVTKIITSLYRCSFLRKSKLLKPATNHKGYLEIALSIKGKLKTHTIHSLVAKAFIPNPENKPTVNHKDGIKENNYVDNLEWATKSEQSIHAYEHNLNRIKCYSKGKFGSKNSFSKKVSQYTKDNVFITNHGSIIEAAEITNTNKTSICLVCRNKQKTAGGYIWKYNVEKTVTK